MTLSTLWFVLIAVLWTGFFVLDGFDLGVGAVHGVIGRDEAERGAVMKTIGPLWDGNEVWLVVAVAAMFAAFPVWYATAFSGLYLVIVLLLAALIVRGVSIEYRTKHDSRRWRRTWGVLLTAASALVPVLAGVALANLLHGVPVNASQEFTGSVSDLLNPYAVVFGLVLLTLCILHGAAFIALRTAGDVGARAAATARLVAPLAVFAVLALVVWTHVIAGNGVIPNMVQVVAVLAVGAAWWLLHERRANEAAFAATGVAIGSTVLSLFADLYPRLMVSSTNPAYDLTVEGSAASPYALRLITIITAVVLPLVLVYQGWSFHVFRQRVRGEIPAASRQLGASTPPPVAAAPPVPAPRPPG